MEKTPSSQINTNADSTVKCRKRYFGHKGHTGGSTVDSRIICKRSFTSAGQHDSKEWGNLLSGDEKAISGDSAYSNKAHKHKTRREGMHDGTLDKETHSKKLSVSKNK